jgi:uncharacterized protein (TIGR02145 family)
VTVFACSFTAGTATGSTATFTDPRDGKKYKTVVMPDGRTWFAQNLNYTKDLTFNKYSFEANGKQFTSPANGVPAIGSYWCPGMEGATYSGDPNTCNIYGALYTWETVMMVDGKYADETKTGSAWDESWVSGNYYDSGSAAENPNADKNNARGGTNAKGGGRGICPMGWHVPTNHEWAILLDKLDGDGSGAAYATQTINSGYYNSLDAISKLMSPGTFSHTGSDPGDGSWIDHSIATIPSGFDALPSADFHPSLGYFWKRGTTLTIQSSSVYNKMSATGWWYSRATGGFYNGCVSRSQGLTIRCILD